MTITGLVWSTSAAACDDSRGLGACCHRSRSHTIPDRVIASTSSSITITVATTAPVTADVRRRADRAGHATFRNSPRTTPRNRPTDGGSFSGIRARRGGLPSAPPPLPPVVGGAGGRGGEGGRRAAAGSGSTTPILPLDQAPRFVAAIAGLSTAEASTKECSVLLAVEVGLSASAGRGPRDRHIGTRPLKPEPGPRRIRPP